MVQFEFVTRELWLGERWALEEKPTLTAYSEMVLERPWESRCGLTFMQGNLKTGRHVRRDDIGALTKEKNDVSGSDQ